MTLATRLTGRWLSGRWLWLFAVLVALSAATLVFMGYRAVTEWRQAANQVALRRTQAAADLLATALTRDMHGAQQFLRTSLSGDNSRSSPTDLVHPVAIAFARFPYIEAFFWWNVGADPDSVVFFSRTERPPSWLSAQGDGPRPLFPVTVITQPNVAALLVERISLDAADGRRLSVFERDLGGGHSQVVTQISYFDPLRERQSGAIGFVVNLEWSRRHYFSDLASQLEPIADPDGAIKLIVLDNQGRPVGGGEDDDGLALLESAPQTCREFPVAFFDPIDLTIDPPEDLILSSWSAMAIARSEPTLVAAEEGAQRTLWMASGMALALIAGVVLSLQAARTRTRLADMRADFVSAITHELKTPIANLRAISETIASGRGSVESSREYAQLGIQEANRLSRLVNNLLAYSRVTDVADVYAFEPVAIDTVVNRTLQEFSLNLQAGAFDIKVDIPEDVPAVWGDPWALDLMLNNLVDNAIRYSGPANHQLSISAHRTNGGVALKVADRGIGIPDDELQRVRKRFVRGRAPQTAGTGLGLAIVDRIVSDHGGSLHIESQPSVGTTVTVTLMVAT